MRCFTIHFLGAVRFDALGYRGPLLSSDSLGPTPENGMSPSKSMVLNTFPDTHRVRQIEVRQIAGIHRSAVSEYGDQIRCREMSVPEPGGSSDPTSSRLSRSSTDERRPLSGRPYPRQMRGLDTHRRCAAASPRRATHSQLRLERQERPRRPIPGSITAMFAPWANSQCDEVTRRSATPSRRCGRWAARSARSGWRRCARSPRTASSATAACPACRSPRA
jgi:hypothetical protein